jgi:branched-chain amino acid transport system ATP-binding protein
MEYLKIQNVTKRFGGLEAVRHFSLKMKEKTIMGIIGPNGAGKTTLLNLINGFYKPDSGEIFFKNKRLPASPYKVARMGIGRLFQTTRIFGDMTILEYLLTPWSRERMNEMREKALELLKFFDLAHLKGSQCKNLSGGQQRLLQMAGVMMLNPEVYLLDEPFYGIAPPIKEKMCEFILKLNKEKNKSFIVVSHDVPSIMKICRRVVAMAYGELIADGSPREIRKDERYLGK